MSTDNNHDHRHHDCDRGRYQCKIVVVALSTGGSWPAARSAALLTINQTIIIIIVIVIIIIYISVLR